ncbi:Nn.00g004040.m01.CDS01 [Neocucurbitaria sp. VM-36]
MLAAQRYYIAVVAVFLVVASCSFYLFRSDEPIAYEPVAKVPYRSSKATLRDTITQLFESIKHDPTSPGYIDASGRYFKGGNETVWTEPLGKKVLIVDIDTRIPTGENQILNPDKLDWEHLDMHGGGLVSNAILNHYFYALIHGYDYKFYQARHLTDLHDTWIMPHVFRELIPDYQFVVAMDADVTISNLDVPLEWMFNRWGVKNHTSMALPWDTEELRNNKSISTDSKGLLVLNTGFVVAQNSNTTQELLEAWRDCTKEERYEGCARWAYEWSHEQRAFSEYIRYDFNSTPETVVSIPCDDAVGWPGFKKDVEASNEGISDCNGNFIRHYTLGKSQVKNAGATSVMQALSEVLQKSILSQQETMWYKEPEKNAEEESQNTEIRKEEEEETADGDVSPVIIEGLITDLPE